MTRPDTTPGPWERNGNTIFTLTPYTGDSAKMRAMAPDGINRFSLMVSNDNREATAEEIEANAKLIQAAPQMAEALEVFVSHCEHGNPMQFMAQLGGIYEGAKQALTAAGYTFP